MISAISEAWQQAASDLGIRVQAPYSLNANDGPTIQFEALICDFGGPKGVLITTVGEDTKFAAATEAGFFCSQLNPDSYSSYVPELFRDTLDDWGWFVVLDVGDGVIQPALCVDGQVGGNQVRRYHAPVLVRP